MKSKVDHGRPGIWPCIADEVGGALGICHVLAFFSFFHVLPSICSPRIAAQGFRQSLSLDFPTTFLFLVILALHILFQIYYYFLQSIN